MIAILEMTCSYFCILIRITQQSSEISIGSHNGFSVTSHYLNQYWPRSSTPFSVIMPHCNKIKIKNNPIGTGRLLSIVSTWPIRTPCTHQWNLVDVCDWAESGHSLAIRHSGMHRLWTLRWCTDIIFRTDFGILNSRYYIITSLGMHVQYNRHIPSKHKI